MRVDGSQQRLRTCDEHGEYNLGALKASTSVINRGMAVHWQLKLAPHHASFTASQQLRGAIGASLQFKFEFNTITFSNGNGGTVSNQQRVRLQIQRSQHLTLAPLRAFTPYRELIFNSRRTTSRMRETHQSRSRPCSARCDLSNTINADTTWDAARKQPGLNVRGTTCLRSCHRSICHRAYRPRSLIEYGSSQSIIRARSSGSHSRS